MYPDSQIPTPEPTSNIPPIITPNFEQITTTSQPSQTPIIQEIPKPKKRILLLLIILLILIVLGFGGYFAYQKFLTPLKQQQISELVTTPVTKNLDPENNTIINCKDMDCFINESKNCNPSQVTNTTTVDIFGVKHTTISSLEIKGLESGKCKFYIKTEKINITFPPEIDKETADEQTLLYHKLEGRDGNCLFNSNDLTDMLIRWSQGDFDTGTISCKLTPSGNECTTEGGDFGEAECSGTYFESSF